MRSNPNSLPLDEWRVRYSALRARADAIVALRIARARRLGREAGIGGDAPFHMAHNAMCGFHAGQPWRGVDYSKVREIQRLERHLWDAHAIVRRWDEAHR